MPAGRTLGHVRTALLGAILATAALVTTACADDAPARTAPTRAVSRVPPTPQPPTPQPPTTSTPVPSGPTVREIADALDAIATVRHPRDNTASCAVKAGCLGLITGGTVSIYQWPSVSAASRYIGEGGGAAADRIGPYVLSYRTTEQQSTPTAVRKAYAAKVRELVGPAA